MLKHSFLFLLAACGAATVSAQPPDANYDESKVPAYVLPDPLVMLDGTRVGSAAEWREKRRPELLHLFADQMYGSSPGRPAGLKFQLLETNRRALGGKAIRKQVQVYFTGKPGPGMQLLLYLPAKAREPVPVFLGLNFFGNQAINSDPAILVTKSWVRAGGVGVENNRSTEKSRGSMSRRWPVEEILQRGYGVATAYYGDIEPDYDGGVKDSIRPLFWKPGQTAPSPGEWAAIADWAWGLSRAMDYLETDKNVDSRRVAVIGHSRLGKAALWAGANDERFAIVISNESGCGGAALSRRAFGETVARINTSFPHWFCGNFKKYNDKEDQLPFDQHELIALIAPRPAYVASAAEDLWSDPRGEFLGALGANPVYRLFAKEGLPAKEMPPTDHPVAGTIGYHVRTGKHDLTAYDWRCYLDFADKQYRKGVK